MSRKLGILLNIDLALASSTLDRVVVQSPSFSPSGHVTMERVALISNYFEQSALSMILLCEDTRCGSNVTKGKIITIDGFTSLKYTRFGFFLGTNRKTNSTSCSRVWQTTLFGQFEKGSYGFNVPSLSSLLPLS